MPTPDLLTMLILAYIHGKYENGKMYSKIYKIYI
jgi:hypothetical protein